VTPRNVNASLGEIPACDSLLWSHQQPEEKPDEFYLSTFDRPNRPYCIDGHTKAFFRAGASPEELMEAIWVAAEMRAGGAYAHSTLMLATLADEEERKRRSAP